jgi:hypothetical protein
VPRAWVSRTGSHNWERRAPSYRALTDAWLTDNVKLIHKQSRGVYGATWIHAEDQGSQYVSLAVGKAAGEAFYNRQRGHSTPGMLP